MSSIICVLKNAFFSHSDYLHTGAFYSNTIKRVAYSLKWTQKSKNKLFKHQKRARNFRHSNQKRAKKYFAHTQKRAKKIFAHTWKRATKILFTQIKEQRQ